jgi:hypothetical protein
MSPSPPRSATRTRISRSCAFNRPKTRPLWKIWLPPKACWRKRRFINERRRLSLSRHGCWNNGKWTQEMTFMKSQLGQPRWSMPIRELRPTSTRIDWHGTPKRVHLTRTDCLLSTLERSEGCDSRLDVDLSLEDGSMTGHMDGRMDMIFDL